MRIFKLRHGYRKIFPPEFLVRNDCRLSKTMLLRQSAFALKILSSKQHHILEHENQIKFPSIICTYIKISLFFVFKAEKLFYKCTTTNHDW